MTEQNSQYYFYTSIQYYILILLTLVFLILNTGTTVDAVPTTKLGNRVNTSDPNLEAQEIFQGLNAPTTMSFLGLDDLLVLERNGTVMRITNSVLSTEPLLNASVYSKGEGGLLGIAVSNKSHDQNVFLYYVERNGSSISNRLYKYELSNNKLINPMLLLDLPADWSGIHNGGKLIFGPDSNLYLVVGDIGGHRTLTQNHRDSEQAIGSVIYRLAIDGEILQNDILGTQDPFNKFYAYGIRNSFGLDFDPVTGNLWDTENGPNKGDEINLVKPGFNSGWGRVSGIWESFQRDKYGWSSENRVAGQPADLTEFEGKGKYSAPELIWETTVAPTALIFFDSDRLGNEYLNDLFVGDYKNGNIYHLDLNEERDDLALNGSLRDRIVSDFQESRASLFAELPGRVTDMQISPDGYLYILLSTKDERNGLIYRISSK